MQKINLNANDLKQFFEHGRVLRFSHAEILFTVYAVKCISFENTSYSITMWLYENSHQPSMPFIACDPTNRAGQLVIERVIETPFCSLHFSINDESVMPLISELNLNPLSLISYQHTMAGIERTQVWWHSIVAQRSGMVWWNSVVE